MEKTELCRNAVISVTKQMVAVVQHFIGRGQRRNTITTIADGFMRVLFSLLSTLTACLELNVAIYHLSVLKLLESAHNKLNVRKLPWKRK